MNNVIYPEALERVLLTKWAEFLDIRKLRHHVSTVLAQELRMATPEWSERLQISRFEINADGFLLWLEVNLAKDGADVNITVESHLSNSGELTFLQAF